MLWLVETFGESYSAGLVGLLVGLTFGIAAQRSQFCLRASVVEFARRQLGPRMAVWLLTLSTAIVWTQAADLAGIINSADARIMAIPGSYSGAIVGGAIFGVGMILTKGCSGRLLVLAASGNLRSAVKGLIFAVVAHSNRCRRLLLRPTIAVATRIKRKHQPASEAVFAARNRFICPFSSKTHCHRQTVERTASQDLAIPDASGEVRTACCVNQLSPPRKPDICNRTKLVTLWPEVRFPQNTRHKITSQKLRPGLLRPAK